MLLATHPQTAGEFQDAAHEHGAEQQGAALADLFLKYVQQQATTLKNVLKDLWTLAPAGRDAFRKEVEKIRRETAAHVATFKDTPEHDRMRKVKASHDVRLSEAVSFAKALDMGYSPDWDQSYHTIVSDARVLLNSNASSGAGKRGRKATPAIEKAKKFLAGLTLSESEEVMLIDFLSNHRVEDTTQE